MKSFRIGHKWESRLQAREYGIKRSWCKNKLLQTLYPAHILTSASSFPIFLTRTQRVLDGRRWACICRMSKSLDFVYTVYHCQKTAVGINHVYNLSSISIRCYIGLYHCFMGIGSQAQMIVRYSQTNVGFVLEIAIRNSATPSNARLRTISWEQNVFDPNCTTADNEKSRAAGRDAQDRGLFTSHPLVHKIERMPIGEGNTRYVQASRSLVTMILIGYLSTQAGSKLYRIVSRGLCVDSSHQNSPGPAPPE